MLTLRLTAAACPRPRSVLWVALALGSGCPRDDPEPAADPSGPAPARETLQLRRQAQREALDRLAPLVAEAAALDDPVTAASRSDGPPRMPPITAVERAAALEALEAAQREARDLTPRLLEPGPRIQSLAARFVLDRMRDRYLRQGPWVEDPTWITAEAERVLDSLELHARRAGACSHCAASLPRVARALEAATTQVRQASPARARAAAADARRLAERIRALPGAPEDATPQLGAFAAAMDELATRGSAPARLGEQALRRQLEVDEDLADAPADLFTRLGSAVAMLSALSKKHPAPPQTKSTPVTAARCAAAWSHLLPLIDARDGLEAGGFECGAFVSGAGSTTFDDPGLHAAIVDAALVRPQRLKAQAEAPPILAFIGGRIPRGSQRHTLRTALLLGSPELSQAAARALRDELDAACLAAAALWIHAELGDDGSLAERLDDKCPEGTPEYIARAEARPRRSLEGLALSRVPLGPAGVVPLDALWWLPLGVLEHVAEPVREDPAPSRVRAVVEPIVPETTPHGDTL